MFRRFVLPALGLLLLALPGHAQTLRIAAAADLQPVLPKLLAEYQRSSGVEAETSYEASATLTTQILNGAPYDLFLAANRAFPQRVVDAGLAVEPQPVTYAQGILVLWARNGASPMPLTMNILTSPAVHRIAVANPAHAPYGAAALAALHSLQLYAAVQSNLVFAENIVQAAQFAQSGNADCALISKTLAITPSLSQTGHFVPVPANVYPPLEQGAVVLRHATYQDAAQKFLNYLLSPAGRAMLAASGLDAPAEKP